mgnify:CR=1 FL=1
MSIKSFFQLVEIQTKLASVIPLAMGTTFALYRYHTFNIKVFVLMFISLLAFDMATTAINNYCDYKYEVNNAIVRNNLKDSTVLKVIFILLIVAVTAGIILTLNTDIVILLVGGLSFFIGIFYTFGPIPISRMPLGEAFSGIFMGFVIIFLSVYIHIFDTNIISLIFKINILSININIFEIFYIFLFSIPAINCIANIMLANNICDLEEDILKKRYTLPYYLGKENALKLFKVLYYISYLDILLLSLLGITPLINIFVLLTFIKADKNIKQFSNEPVKAKNFKLAIANFVLINLPQIALISVALLFM